MLWVFVYKLSGFKIIFCVFFCILFFVITVSATMRAVTHYIANDYANILSYVIELNLSGSLDFKSLLPLCRWVNWGSEKWKSLFCFAWYSWSRSGGDCKMPLEIWLLNYSSATQLCDSYHKENEPVKRQESEWYEDPYLVGKQDVSALPFVLSL